MSRRQTVKISNIDNKINEHVVFRIMISDQENPSWVSRKTLRNIGGSKFFRAVVIREEN